MDPLNTVIIMNWRGIASASGYIIVIIGVLMIFVPLIDLLTGHPITQPFLYSSPLLILLGYALSRIKSEPLGLVDSIVMVSILWITISLIAAIPLMFSLNMDFVNAWFETVSGFTGTGFTVLSGIDYLKPSIVIWRSIMQWTGELGVVVFAIILFPYFHRLGARVYGVERPLKIEASFYRTARRIFIVYSVLTVVGVLAYIYAGMNVYEAINHIFTTISTGGMSTYDRGYQAILERSPITYAPVTIFMFIGATNFMLLDSIIRGKFRSVWKSEEFKLYVFASLSLSALTILSYVLVEGQEPLRGALYGFFNQISGITTTGFSLGSIGSLRPLTKLLLIIGMFIGGMAFSTAGGIKVYRLLILAKRVRLTALLTITMGKYEKAIKVNGSVLDEVEVSHVLVHLLIHLSVVVAGAAVITVYGHDFVDALFEATSAASCVGLSTGIVTSAAPIAVKAVLMALMILGRVEFVQLILIIGYIAWFKTLRVLK